ncbi:MAG: SIS domain-containing protein [Chthoniobacteraceae bacterium]
MQDWITEYLAAQNRAVDSIKPADVAALIDTLRAAHKADAQIFACGNGGNAANMSHFITDLGKNSSEAMGRPFRCLSINDNVSWMTAIGNDYAYEDIFWRQLQNYARPGDVLITSSVSGNSPNVVKALEWGKTHGLKSIALVGGKRGRAAQVADQVLVVEDTHYGRVEDAQMHVLHMLCYGFVERAEARA